MKGSSKISVLYPECTLEPPGELYKQLMPKPHPQGFRLNRPGVRPGFRAFRNSPGHSKVLWELEPLLHRIPMKRGGLYRWFSNLALCKNHLANIKSPDAQVPTLKVVCGRQISEVLKEPQVIAI